ncbi:hypothetical protein [uncultured Flavobacterium sp.]|uniref:hypothetical protein n=1 Tax=uncultured Flavobacterium sp. TaxID=165435 RepID=UPI0030815BAE
MKKYSKEVEELFSYGQADLSSPWPNYVKELHLKEENSEELIDIINTSDLSRAVSGFTIKDFGARHAWRAIGQLKILNAVDSLLKALTNKKNIEAFEYQIELPKVLSLIGDDAIPKLISFLNDKNNDWNFKIIIFKALVNIAIQNPEHKDTVLAVFKDLSIDYEENYIFISSLLNILFQINPVDSEVVKEIIDKNKYDFGIIDEKAISKFIKDARMYE